MKDSDIVDSDVALTTLNEGIQWADTEHRLLRDERAALESFNARLENIEPKAVSHSSPGLGAVRTLGSPAGGERLAAVRDAYRETVMSVNHYDEEYGESFGQHVYNEFGPDLAAALERGSTFPSPVHRRLQTGVAEAVEGRTRVLELLATERDGLRAVRADLVPACEKLNKVRACPFNRWTTAALHTEYNRVEAARDRCERRAAERQCARREHIQDRSALPHRAVTEGYLYQPLDTSYPGLTALAVLGDRLRETARELRLALLRRPSATDDAERRSRVWSVDDPV